MPQLTRFIGKDTNSVRETEGFRRTSVQITEPVQGWGSEWKDALKKINSQLACFVDELNCSENGCYYTVNIDKNRKRIVCKIYDDNRNLRGQVTYKFSRFVNPVGQI